MKLSLALFSTVATTAFASDSCRCPCGSGNGVWVDSFSDGNCHEPKRMCAHPNIARELVERRGKGTCVETCPQDACTKSKPSTCPQYSKTVEGTEKLNPYVPKPEKCVMKRSREILMFEPNFPAGRPDVYIEVEISNGDRFQFYPDNYPELQDARTGVVPFEDPEVFQILFDEQEKLGGQGFKLRYVSKNGPGEWNSCKYSPIAFDLTGDGVVGHITSPAGFKIDITGDGEIEHLSEWFAPDEGILIDAHNEEGLTDFSNGIITGDHMMGDMAGTYTDGFAKLATYDHNCDDKLTGDELQGLYIWMDKNSNTHLDEGELYELSDFGIIALNTVHDNLRSHAELADGSTMLMEDLWFDPFERKRRLEAAKARSEKKQGWFPKFH